MDIAGPSDVFDEANTLYGHQYYRIVIAGPTSVIRSSSGIALQVDYDLAGAANLNIDTCIVAGSPRAANTEPDEELASWLFHVYPNVRRMCSICGGIFPLAKSSLINDQVVAAHWNDKTALETSFPGITVDQDAILVVNGSIRTAAGVSAGLDLGLSLVTEDLGSDIARQVAQQLIVFYKRPGGQLQYAHNKQLAPAGRSALQNLQRRILQNLNGNHSVDSMAQSLGLSRRHLIRLFEKETGLSPTKWVETARVSAARVLLEEELKAPKVVASRCGFSSVRSLRRAFLQQIGISPADYRRRFGSSK
nr:helix-turn-helix domain-containing protein [Acetobacter pasteurianus]